MINCDICHSSSLEMLYTVPNSQRGMEVNLCTSCGLLQSIQTKGKPTDATRIVTTSSDANWGNVRHGKGLRLEAMEDLLIGDIPWENCQTVIDIGSNRGDFFLWLRKRHPHLQLTGIEPDPRVVHAYKDLPNLKLHLERFENSDLQEESFDVAYCSHTLEHANSGAEMLNKICDILKIGGYAFIEVPNAEVLNEHDIVEEFFIDKHNFHYGRAPLLSYIKHIGFEILFGEQETDISNVTFLLKKISKRNGRAFTIKNPKLVEHNRAMLKKYQQTLSANRGKLKQVAKTLEAFMEKQKVAFWGAGRIFDALVRYGGLNTDKLTCVIDQYLSRHLDSIHNTPIYAPEQLKIVEPQVVFILAKSSADDIYQQVKRYGIRHIVKFEDLLTQ